VAAQQGGQVGENINVTSESEIETRFCFVTPPLGHPIPPYRRDVPCRITGYSEITDVENRRPLTPRRRS